ncbi:MAG: outer membrane protein assembly factor BamA [Gammaproteobacteria bacterium]|nr:outer membrane protein assembly factor BamA [Gammaproteobacteria bacterium]
MLKKTIVIATTLALFANIQIPAQAFVVKDIQFVGLQRVPLSTVRADVPVTIGQDFQSNQSQAVIEDLFKTGYFSDVSLYNNKGVLTIKVVEQPTIASIAISGNEAIKTAQLQTVLNNVGLQVGNMFNRSLLRQIQQSLEQQYNTQGKYAVKVDTVINPLPRNRVGIDIKVSEGLSAKIIRINVVGNHAFDESTVVDQLSLTTPGFMAFFTGSDKYSQDKLSKSLQALSDYYMNRGYAKFHIDSTQVAIDSTKTKVFLTINVSEGQKYTFKGFKLMGNLIVPESKLASQIKIKPGATFSKQTVLDGSTAITNALGNLGYAFVNVNPVPTIDDKTKSVYITYYVIPGQKVYIRHVTFSGNTVTNDNALRERMRYVEGSLYSKTNLDYSKITLQRLSYISAVDDKTVPVSGTSNQVDENYNLTETSANSVSGNIGYSELDGVIVGAGLSIPDVFGTGNIFSINTQISKPSQSVSFNFTQPYFTMNGVIQAVGLYFSRTNAADQGLANYSTNSYGGTLNYQIPISTWNYFNVGGGVDRTQLEQPADSSSETVTSFIAQHGTIYNSLLANLGWSRDSTNSAYFPTQGEAASVGTRIAVPGSDLNWYQLLSNLTWFHSLTDSVTGSLGGGASFGGGYGNTSHMPFFDNFTGGGWGSVRGYSAGTMGPSDTLACTSGSDCTPGTTSEGNALGGNLSVNATANLYFPVPFAADSQNLRLVTFLDAGNVYNTYHMATEWDAASQPTSPSLSNIRYSAGVGIEWVSPLGPLGFSLAAPLNKKPGDNTQIFQFTLGTFFS